MPSSRVVNFPKKERRFGEIQIMPPRLCTDDFILSWDLSETKLAWSCTSNSAQVCTLAPHGQPIRYPPDLENRPGLRNYSATPLPKSTKIRESSEIGSALLTNSDYSTKFVKFRYRIFIEIDEEK